MEGLKFTRKALHHLWSQSLCGQLWALLVKCPNHIMSFQMQFRNLLFCLWGFELKASFSPSQVMIVFRPLLQMTVSEGLGRAPRSCHYFIFEVVSLSIHGWSITPYQRLSVFVKESRITQTKIKQPLYSFHSAFKKNHVFNILALFLFWVTVHVTVVQCDFAAHSDQSQLLFSVLIQPCTSSHWPAVSTYEQVAIVVVVVVF